MIGTSFNSNFLSLTNSCNIGKPFKEVFKNFNTLLSTLLLVNLSNDTKGKLTELGILSFLKYSSGKALTIIVSFVLILSSR